MENNTPLKKWLSAEKCGEDFEAPVKEKWLSAEKDNRALRYVKK